MEAYKKLLAEQNHPSEPGLSWEGLYQGFASGGKMKVVKPKNGKASVNFGGKAVLEVKKIDKDLIYSDPTGGAVALVVHEETVGNCEPHEIGTQAVWPT